MKEYNIELHKSSAQLELKRIKNLHAFNIVGYNKKQKINQYLTIYSFPDGSVLKIYPSKGLGISVYNNHGIDTYQEKLLVNK